MKLLASAFALLSVPALAQNNLWTGYRDCNPSKLSACENSNQLIWGQNKGKTEFPHALSKFLKGAPKRYEGTHGYTVAESAKDAITGPGSHHDRLPNGGWFFDGFTPHMAPFRGAVLFDEAGHILVVALRDTTQDSPSTEFGHEMVLRIYTHDALQLTQIKLLRDWAGKADKVRLISLDNKKWSAKTLP